ncbi:CcdC family protein [Alkalicoccus luteus]|uniref:Cytochrome c biogenesis protein CcdC n=1 Tax=Alkalicoccus luteus TaxID=1237094 RepID=A0A969TUC9_9BACI|nr:cytochrome c biogenesis protein CcdC [Alkalicoccus luteus]NJP37210.1 cytochrome c biogenesis protein CcdC [Alkalicoccus luteus]
MYAVLFAVAAFLMACAAVMIRMRAMKKPASVKKILIPPAAMSTGFLMFLYPPVQQITWLEAAEAFTVGLLFSIILIKTSSFEIRNGDVYMKRSKWFPVILMGLLGLRLVFKLALGIYFSYEVLAGMFFLLAFGMLLPWRIAMFVKFRRVQKEFLGRQEKEPLQESAGPA